MTKEKLNVDKIISKPYQYILQGTKLESNGNNYILLDINITKNELVLFNLDIGGVVTMDCKTELITSVHSFASRYFKLAEENKDRLLSVISTNII